MIYSDLGKTKLKVPPVIFGTSCLGNLYDALPDDVKQDIMQQWFVHMERPVVLDSAGKYGAGLALEVIGNGLEKMNIPPQDVIISNKLGWLRVPLTTPEPQFEKGVWKDLQHDAVQKINYDGILECWEQGCELLGEKYKPEMVSVHDPDEYLAQASSSDERNQIFDDIIGAYQALLELKEQGETKAVGIGSKDWRVIQEISKVIDLDWVMLAVSYTILNHPPELIEFVDDLAHRNIGIINSAVFHAGFLTGGKYFDYRVLDINKKEDKPLFNWREAFFAICNQYNVKPAAACVQFGNSHPGIKSIALNTSKPERIKQNVEIVTADIPGDFWSACKREGLISKGYPYID